MVVLRANQTTLMSRLQQWMNPQTDRNEKKNGFHRRSSNKNRYSIVNDFRSPPQIESMRNVDSSMLTLPCDFSVPPPSIRVKCGMNQPILSKNPSPDALSIVSPKFSVPPPEISRSFKSSFKASSLPDLNKRCLPSSHPMLTLDKEQAVWQKVLCTVQSAVNHGKATRDLLELLKGIKLSNEKCGLNVVMESNNNGFINSPNDSYPIKGETTGISSVCFNMTDNLPSVSMCKDDKTSILDVADAGCFSRGRSADSLRNDIFSSSTPSSGSSGINTGHIDYTKNKSLVPSGCTFCYAHFKRHCQLQQIKWPRMEEPGHFWHKHAIRDEHGNVTCPELRLKVCELCHATGSNAHTKRFCPLKFAPSQQ